MDEKNENVKDVTWTGVINHTCPDCITKRCTKNLKNEMQRTEIEKAKPKRNSIWSKFTDRIKKYFPITFWMIMFCLIYVAYKFSIWVSK